MTDFPKYKEMKVLGKSAAEVYATARADGLNQLVSIYVLREVYGLSLVEAKKVSFEVDTGQDSEVSQPGLQKQYTDI